MENITEKKWFVYVKDHHEGPHSLLEIQDQLNRGLIESQGFVWSEGMEDWQRMTDVAAFRPILKHKPLGASVSQKPSSSESSVSSAASQMVEQVMESKPLDFSLQEELLDAAQEPQQAEAPSKSRTFLLRGFVVLAIFSGLIGSYRMGYLDPVLDIPPIQRASDHLSRWSKPYLLKLADAVPFLDSLISPIPRLDDVTPEDYEELKQAARANLKKFGPKFAIALSRNHPGSPAFYVTTNLGEGARFRVAVEGIPDTLLNQISFYSQLDTVTTQGMAKTEAVRYLDGRVIPRGEYRIYLTLAEDQPAGVSAHLNQIRPLSVSMPHDLPKSSTVLAVKTYFLAGNKDRSYQERLKDFHDKLRARASSELIEAKQFMLTLSSQLDSTQEKFNQLAKAKTTPQQRKQWEHFHKEWSNLQGELDQIFQKWSLEALKNEYFYGEYYQILKDLSRIINQLHGRQQGFFNGVEKYNEAKLEIKSESEEATRILQNLQGKIDRIEKLPPAPNGMPQRDVW